MPPHMLPVLGSPTVVNIVGVCDSILYKAISGVLMPTVLQALPDRWVKIKLTLLLWVAFVPFSHSHISVQFQDWRQGCFSIMWSHNLVFLLVFWPVMFLWKKPHDNNLVSSRVTGFYHWQHISLPPAVQYFTQRINHICPLFRIFVSHQFIRSELFALTVSAHITWPVFYEMYMIFHIFQWTWNFTKNCKNGAVVQCWTL